MPGVDANCGMELLKNEARLYLPHSGFGGSFFDIFL